MGVLNKVKGATQETISAAKQEAKDLKKKPEANESWQQPTKASITPMDGKGNIIKDAEIKFMFNPNELKISRSAPWSSQNTDKMGSPEYVYMGRDAMTLTLEKLIFDSYFIADDTERKNGRKQEVKDVREKTKKLWTLLEPKEIKSGGQDQTYEETVGNIKTTKTRKGQIVIPPTIIFQWGSGFYFKAVITSMSETGVLFTPSGLWLRSEVSLTLAESAYHHFYDQDQKGNYGSAKLPHRNDVDYQGSLGRIKNAAKKGWNNADPRKGDER